MAEVGIDITAQTQKIFTTDAVQASDVVITMGCGDSCPTFPVKSYRDWVLDDPGQARAWKRFARSATRSNRVEALIAELPSQPVASGGC